MTIESPLDVFYGTDFALSITRSRIGTPDITFAGIVGEEAADEFDERIATVQRWLQFASGPDVRNGDTLLVVHAVDQPAVRYRVQDLGPTVDGAEMRARLTLVNKP